MQYVCRQHILQRYEGVPQDKKPFTEAANRKHMDDNDISHHERKDMQDELHGDLKEGAADSAVHRKSGPPNGAQQLSRSAAADDTARAQRSGGQHAETDQSRYFHELQAEPDWQHYAGSHGSAQRQ